MIGCNFHIENREGVMDYEKSVRQTLVMEDPSMSETFLFPIVIENALIAH